MWPAVTGIDPMVHFLSASAVTASCLKGVLIVDQELFQCLGFPYAQVWSGANHYFPQLRDEPLLPSWFRLLVLDDCGPHGRLPKPYNGASTQHLVLIRHIRGADGYFWLGYEHSISGTLLARSNEDVGRPLEVPLISPSPLSHRAGITSLPTRESLADLGRVPGLHSVTSSRPSRSRWRPRSMDTS